MTRPGLAVILAGCCTLGAPAVVNGADREVLDQLHVEPGHTYDQTKIDLDGGQTYGLIVSGEVSQPPFGGSGETLSYDALYCRGTARKSSECGPNDDPVRPAHGFGQLLFQDGQLNDTWSSRLDVLAGRPGQIAYRDDHTYTDVFVAHAKDPSGRPYPNNARMPLGIDMGDLDGCTNCTGGFDVWLIGPPAHEAWEVTFRVRQRGEPRTNTPASDALAGTGTVITGKMFFSKRPRSGARGSVAATITHVDDFLAPDLQTSSQTVTLIPGSLDGRYRSHDGARTVTFNVIVGKTANQGAVPPEFQLLPPDEGQLGFTDDTQGLDRLAVLLNGDGHHDHDSYPQGKDNLKVTVSVPHRVKS
jgi:hypothetical protein